MKIKVTRGETAGAAEIFHRPKRDRRFEMKRFALFVVGAAAAMCIYPLFGGDTEINLV